MVSIELYSQLNPSVAQLGADLEGSESGKPCDIKCFG